MAANVQFLDLTSNENGVVKQFPDSEDENEKLERQHFIRVLTAFLNYKKYSDNRIDKAKNDFLKLDAKHQELLPEYLDNLELQRDAVAKNYDLIQKIVGETGYIFENVHHGINVPEECGGDQEVSLLFMEKVMTTLKQFVRDWSDEGKEEREKCYDPIISEIQKLFPEEEFHPSDISILVPGAGLARLMVDIARCGYTVQGNEWSLFMLVASNYILNKCCGIYHTTIYPFVHQSCNNWSPAHQVFPVQIPDFDPSTLPTGINFSMNAGNFTEIYDEEAQWDCVATCFFIDTAHNIISYIDTIYRILKPGGYWINLGPLLYHFADVPNESSVEVSYKELRKLVVEDFKFELIKEDNSIKTTYIGNKRSMMHTIYQCVFFVARKPEI